MTLFQIITLPVLLWFGYRQLAKFKGAPVVKVFYQLRWLFITFITILFVSEPVISSMVAQKLGIGRGVDVVIYFALMWLLYQNYHQSEEIEKLYDKLDKLVRQVSLKGSNEEKANGSTQQHKKRS
ncbi:MAG: DUF2304 domain-containing protein [bacterium]